YRLDRGARNKSGGKRQLLVDNGENAATGWIDRNNRAVVAPQPFDCGLAHDRIVKVRYIFLRGIGKSGNTVSMPDYSVPDRGARDCRASNCGVYAHSTGCAWPRFRHRG